ncbi:hypothetical protein MF672_004645 [Actinomadura sp. ATCC 31491]|uniref:DUF3558 domain-containing protein n=1 Tax=Actinomadura luzonensis TaxID=2805427 RepID=A0ABT0FLH0_9ACTN|nr:hypothetical protein [Actinomadura luzonensis]MCK2213089.1 hypothetical protein [Actinomadura luzonensis]
MIGALARATAAALLMAPALAACSAPSGDPLLKDPARWPLARLKGVTGVPRLPDEAERALAQIKVGPYDLTAWIHPSGLCGLSGPGWSMHEDLTRTEGDPARPDGFSGPTERASGVSSESKVTLFCTPTRMLIRVEGETRKPSVSGDAVAQVVGGGLNAVVGTEEARRESLPGATVTRGG